MTAKATQLWPLLVLLAVPVASGSQPRIAFAATAGSTHAFSNFSAEAASRTLAEIDAATALFRRIAGVEPAHPIRAFAIESAESLREVAPQFWERRGVRPRAIAYAGPHAAFIAVRDDLPAAERQQALLHEYVHVLTAAALPDAPAWLDEGLSEFWGSVVIDGDRVIVGRPVQKHLARLRSSRSVRDTLRQRRGVMVPDSERTTLFYAQSWAIVHYLLLGPGSREPLEFLPRQHTPPDNVDDVIRDYVRTREFREVIVPFRGDGGVPARAFEISYARALAERANMLVFGARPQAALPVAKRALALEPKEPLALEVMGTYYFLHNRPVDARYWLGLANDTNAASYAAPLYLALLAPNDGARERYLLEALQRRPDSEVAWQRLGAIYEQDGRAAAIRRWCRYAKQAARFWFWAGAPGGCE